MNPDRGQVRMRSGKFTGHSGLNLGLPSERILSRLRWAFIRMPPMVRYQVSYRSREARAMLQVIFRVIGCPAPLLVMPGIMDGFLQARFIISWQIWVLMPCKMQ